MDSLTIEQYKIRILEKLKQGNLNPKNLGIDGLSHDLGYDICASMAKDHWIDMGKTGIRIRIEGEDFLEQYKLSKEVLHHVRDFVLRDRGNLPKVPHIPTQNKKAHAGTGWFKKSLIWVIKTVSTLTFWVIIGVTVLIVWFFLYPHFKDHFNHP